MTDLQAEECSLVETELGSTQSWLIKLRWFAGVGVIVSTWVGIHVLNLGLAAIPLYALGIGILVYNAFFYWRLNTVMHQADWCQSGGAHTLAYLQVVADWVAMTLLIHYSGGIESPALVYFFFHIILAAILLSPRATYLFVGVASLLVGGTAWLEYFEILPHVTVEGFLCAPLYQEPVYVGGVLFFFISTAFVSAYLATRTTTNLRKRQNEVVQLTEQLQKAYQRRQMLYESAQSVTSTLDLERVLDRLTETTTKEMDVLGCSIRLLNRRGNKLSLASVYGLGEDYMQKGDLELKHNPVVRKVLSGEVVAVDDVSTDPRVQYQEEAIDAGIRSTLSAPLRGRIGPLGILRVYCDRVQRFTEDDKIFLSAVASHGSIAIENAMAYQAVQNLEEAKRKFVLTVTHELRSPVGVVRSLLRTMTGGYAGELSDLQQDMLERALRRADFLQTLIDDLLDLASGKTGLRVVQEAERINLSEMVREITERYEVPTSEKGVELHLEIGEDAEELRTCATSGEMDRVLNNLVSNAVKYTPAGGEVTITLHRKEDKARLTVSDTGIGIPEDALPNLFEEFYRAPNAKAQVKEGTGLGLAVTRDIVMRYGGRITVQSEENVGTTFTVTFPLAPADTEACPAPQSQLA